jgi:hypothetical protein
MPQTVSLESPSSVVICPKRRYLLRGICTKGSLAEAPFACFWVVAGLADGFCVPTGSASALVIKTETAKKAMDRNLCRVFMRLLAKIAFVISNILTPDT